MLNHTICVDPKLVEIRPANGTPDDIIAQGFIGAYAGTNDDGTISVTVYGEVPDLKQAVFLRGMTRAEFEAAMK